MRSRFLASLGMTATCADVVDVHTEAAFDHNSSAEIVTAFGKIEEGFFDFVARRKLILQVTFAARASRPEIVRTRFPQNRVGTLRSE